MTVYGIIPLIAFSSQTSEDKNPVIHGMETLAILIITLLLALPFWGFVEADIKIFFCFVLKSIEDSRSTK